jgi:hypothetical protein
MEKILEVYKKEREYQRECFGEYINIKSLNFASFLNFIKTYLEKAEKSYSEKWDQSLPPWLLSCKEIEEGSAPVQAYEELIKVMALAGAALETYTDINPEEWRGDPNEGRKWKE